MTENEVKTTWNNIVRPFFVYVVLFIVAISIKIFGSQDASTQTAGLTASAFTFIFIVFYAVKMFKFRKKLKQLNNN